MFRNEQGFPQLAGSSSPYAMVRLFFKKGAPEIKICWTGFWIQCDSFPIKEDMAQEESRNNLLREWT